jgi:AcrR family transcriptional regulator
MPRLRDAAIARFGRDGFAVGLRAIAAHAGVTAALIVHHFGSKEGLRRACDEHVLAVVRAEVGGDDHRQRRAVTAGVVMSSRAPEGRTAPGLPRPSVACLFGLPRSPDQAPTSVCSG